jgi:hypothetical protein
MDPVVPAHTRLPRLAEKPHTRLFRRSSTFVMIARFAGRYQILPAVWAATMARNHMVDGQVSRLFPAVLTGIVIAKKQLTTCEFRHRVYPLDQIQEPNHRRTGVRGAGRVDLSDSQFDDLGLAVADENERTPSRTHVERLEVLIENKHLMVHDGLPRREGTADATGWGGIGDTRFIVSR